MLLIRLKTNDIENALVEIEIEVKEDHEEAMISKKKLEKSDVSDFVVTCYLLLLLNHLMSSLDIVSVGMECFYLMPF